MEPRRTTFPSILLVGFLTAIVMAAYSIYLDTVFREFERLQPPTTREDLLAIGTLSEEHKEFIDRVSRELKTTKKVEVIMIPALFLVKGGRLVETREYWLILIEQDFYAGLEPMEQKALLGHELGHIIFTPPACRGYMSCQMGADLFAATHTSPDAVIGLLNKLFQEPHPKAGESYQKKAEEERKIRIGNMEKLKTGH